MPGGETIGEMILPGGGENPPQKKSSGDNLIVKINKAFCEEGIVDLRLIILYTLQEVWNTVFHLDTFFLLVQQSSR